MSHGSTSIGNFLNKTEKILDLNCSKFSKTSRTDILWIEPIDFWLSCPIRRSLLTLLLRCGMVYDGNYEEALFSQDYAFQTKLAIERFLFGFTKYVDHSDRLGWANTFRGKKEKEVKIRLVRAEPFYEVVSYGTLWGN
jgi:hypothetical protein